MNNVNRRQFIIMDEPYQDENFEFLELLNGKTLSYHKDLKVVSENQVVLLGYAFSVKEKEIHLTGDVLTEKRFWAGRWVLIYNNQVHMDACGTLGCYYAFDESGSIYISSSLHILNGILDRKKISNYEVKHGDGNGMLDYYPIPCTPFENIKRLLPSQYIDLEAEEPIQAFPDYMMRRYKDNGYKWLQSKFIEEMSTLLKNIETEFKGEVWITLTGGVDSRTIFAIAQHSGISFKTYTAKRFNLKKWDRDYPIKICKKYKKEHIYIDDTRQTDGCREKEFDIHCEGCAVGTERQQYIAASDVPVQEKAVVLWGTVWPVSIKAYHVIFKDTDIIDEQIQEIRKVCGNIVEKSNVHEKSIKEWLKWVQKQPLEDMDWRERMYLEQRTGAWVGTASQAIDLFDSVRIAPVNCQELLELLLSVDGEPGDKLFQKEIVSLCCPKLRKIPYGEPTNPLYRGVRKIRKVIKRLGGR